MSVLILGDGLLGSELHRQTGWSVSSRKLKNLPTLDNSKDILNLVKDYNIVVNCIAHTDSYSDDKEQHLNINFKFVKILSDLCNQNGIKLVHISTEFVYARNFNLPSEEDLPLPDSTWYAYTKLLADEYIKVSNSNFLICRELHKPKPFNYPEVWRVRTSGDTVDKISKIIVKLIENNARGVFNVGTGTKFLKTLNPEAIEIDPPSYVPLDTTMNINKLKKFYEEHNIHS